MRTDDLIARLSNGLEPVKSRTVARILIAGLALGLAGSVAVMLMAMGPRHNLHAAMAHFGMWMKLAYTLAIAVFGFWIVERAGRPGAVMTKPILLATAPVLAIALLAGLELTAPGADMAGQVMGQSSRVCTLLVAMTALPSLAAAFWALRQLAPTRLGLAGAGAGLLAGGVGAFVYCFHCPEEAPAFVAIWYTLGIALTTGIGGILGPRLLRW